MATASGDPFDEPRLLASARRSAGSDDFGSEPFLEPLAVLLDSLHAAPLNDLGSFIMRGTLLRSLIQRLRAEQWWTDHPEILDEPIEAPVVVVRMMRSGTTLLQRVLASDPRFACAYGWEVGEPSPRPGWHPAAPDPRIADAEEREAQTRVFAAELFAIHPTYVHEAEEEIVFLADAFLSHIPEASCNVPAIDRGSTPRTSPPRTAGCDACSSCSSGRSVSGASRCAPSCSRRPTTSATYPCCWPSSPTPTSCTRTATRWR